MRRACSVDTQWILIDLCLCFLPWKHTRWPGIGSRAAGLLLPGTTRPGEAGTSVCIDADTGHAQ